MSGAPVRVGVLGCADIATRRVLPALAAEPGTELRAVASRDGARAAEVAGRYGCAAVTGYPALLERSDIDAVYVPLPVALHAEWVERALRAGRHVLAEKPLTTGAERTAELAALAGARGLVLMENFMFLRHRTHRRVRELAAGTVGELRTFEAAFTIPPPAGGDIRYRRDLGGGALLDIGVYPLRAAQLFLGPRLDVVGAALREDPRHGVDVAGTALLRNPRGDTAQLTFGMAHAYRNVYALWGSEGGMRVERAFTPPPDHRHTVYAESRGARQDLLLEADDQCANTVRAFAAAAGAGEGAREGAGLWAQEAVQLAGLVDAVRRTAS